MAKLDPHGTDYVLREVTLTCREDLLALENISMTLLKDTNYPVCRQLDPIKILADEDHTLGAVLPIGWLPPHNSKCQGKVKLLGVEDNFEIDPKFPQSYTITVPFSPKSAMDLPAAGTPAQWWQVKCDLDRIYDRFLKTLNSWGVWDSAMILSKEGERLYGKAIKKLEHQIQ